MKRILAVITILVLVLTLASCGKTEEPASATVTGTKDLGVKEIIVGLVAPQTGASAFMGIAQAKGAQMAIDEINAAGGVCGVPLRLVVRDDESDPTKSLTYTQQVVLNEGAAFMIGQSNSACALACVEFITENKILTLHPMATSSSIVDPVKFPYSFRVHCSNDRQAKGMINLAIEAGYKEAVILGDTSDLGVTGMASLKKYAEEYGLTITDEITFVNGDADLSPVATSIKNTGTKLVLSFAMGADSAKILEALGRVDYLNKTAIIGYSGSISTNVKALAGTLDLSNVYGVVHGDMCLAPNADKLTAQSLYEKYNELYGHFTQDGSGRTFDTFGGLRTYEAIMIAAWAIENTGSLNGDDLAKYIENHSSEYQPHIVPTPFTYSATDHEGWNPQNVYTVTMDSIINDGVNYFGDVYRGVSVAPVA